MEDLGYDVFFLITAHMKVPPRQMIELIKDPIKLKDRIMKYVAELIEAKHNAEKLIALEEENKKLREENKVLRKKLRSKEQK